MTIWKKQTYRFKNKKKKIVTILRKFNNFVISRFFRISEVNFKKLGEIGSPPPPPRIFNNPEDIHLRIIFNNRIRRNLRFSYRTSWSISISGTAKFKSQELISDSYLHSQKAISVWGRGVVPKYIFKKSKF